MNEQEFIHSLSKIGSKIDSKITLYQVGCKECVTYNHGNNNGNISWNCITTGLMDGKDEEFRSLQDAQATVDLHRTNNPLHYPYVLPNPLVEYLTHTDKYMMRYRANNPADSIRIHSINGYVITSNKCAYACKLCGAIYRSKDYPNHSFFKTGDTKCNKETHYNENTICGLTSVGKICICPTIFQEAERREEQQKKIKSIEWWNKHPNECHVCHKPFFAPGHVFQIFNPYPTLEEDVEIGKLPYERQARLSGPKHV